MAFSRALSRSPRSTASHPRSLARVFFAALSPSAFDSAAWTEHAVEHVNVAVPGLSRTTSNDGWRPSARVQAVNRALHSHVEVS